MYKELQRLRTELQSKKPYSRDIAVQLRQLDLLDQTCCGMLLDGDELSRGDIMGMLDGEIPKDVSLKKCIRVRNYAEVAEVIHDSLDLECSLDTKLLIKFYRILTGKDDGFRKSNYMDVDFRHVPPHHTEIEGKLKHLLWDVYGESVRDVNVIKRAAKLHCGIIEIYPFEEDSSMMARLAMNYYLQEKGFLPVALGFNYKEYMSTVTECLKNGDETLFFWGLERAEFNKLTQVLQIIESEE